MALSIRVPLYDMVVLPPVAAALIDTPEFQRLGRVRQLGFVDVVYPSATKTRREHSLGVAHLARRIGQRLIDSMDVVPRCTPELLDALSVAGLFHDAGHGPFSHSLERALHAAGIEYEHERGSCAAFRAAAARTRIPYGGEWLDLVCAMILGGGDVAPRYASCAPWCLQVVANKRSGLDADRLDYLARDALATEVAAPCDPQRIVSAMRVLRGSGRIGVRCGDVVQLHMYYQARFLMFLNVYTHRKAVAADTMFAELLGAAPPVVERIRAEIAEHGWLPWDDARMIAELPAMRAILDRRIWRVVRDGTVPEERRVEARVTVHYGSGSADPMNDIELCDDDGNFVRRGSEDEVMRACAPAQHSHERVYVLDRGEASVAPSATGGGGGGEGL